MRNLNLKILIPVLILAIFLFVPLIVIYTQGVVAEAGVVITASMEPTLMVQDRVLIEKLFFSFSELKRGDLIVFYPPEEVAKKNPFVKRIIGLPGETVHIDDCIIYINGEPLDEIYQVKTIKNHLPVTICEGKYFVMGDNRGESFDSRNWGCVCECKIIGRVDYILWPLSRLGSI